MIYDYANSAMLFLQSNKIFDSIDCNQSYFFFRSSCSFLVLDPANDRKLFGEFDSQVEMFVRVWKGGSMVRCWVPMFYLKLCNHIHIYI